MSKLTGKVALITGSGRGIGQAVARKLASEGARIVVNDVDEAPALNTVDLIMRAGGHAIACPGSVTAEEFPDRFVNAALNTYGGLDIIVNNAGYTWDNVIQKMSDAQFQAMLDVHVLAPFRILRAASSPIRTFAKKETEEGREVFRKVVNISSVTGTGGAAGQVNYSAAKAAIIGVTKSLAREWGRYRVNVNCVAFGFIHTRLTQALDAPDSKINISGQTISVGVQPARLEVLKSTIPLGRGGSVQEAAGAVYLFCIPESNYISGQTLLCAGGAGQIA
jgi:3-oxoacyl-[acyl-carrier protein] reductase